MLEHARFLKNKGNEVWILAVFFHPDALFDKYFDVPVIVLSDYQHPKKISVADKIRLIFNMRKKLRELKPDLIIGQLIADCPILYMTTLFSNLRYLTHIHGTIMWFPDDNTKYSFLHRKASRHLRLRVIGHQQFYPEFRKAPSLLSALKRISLKMRYWKCISINLLLVLDYTVLK